MTGKHKMGAHKGLPYGKGKVVSEVRGDCYDGEISRLGFAALGMMFGGRG